MKKILRATAALSIGALTVLPAFAQETVTPRNPAQATNRSTASELDSVTQGANIRVSQLTGMSIQNAQGKSVGSINDLVLDANSGKVRYAAVTYGGFLGIGNKMFAVPFEAFKVQRNVDGDTVLVLNVTQQQLEGAVGFDENNWPNFGDQSITSELDKRYGIDRSMHNRSSTPGAAGANLNRNDIRNNIPRGDGVRGNN
jgi:sporulation protein YlmC with PRC-barrel domain